jgi:hypothetical protein
VRPGKHHKSSGHGLSDLPRCGVSSVAWFVADLLTTSKMEIRKTKSKKWNGKGRKPIMHSSTEMKTRMNLVIGSAHKERNVIGLYMTDCVDGFEREAIIEMGMDEARMLIKMLGHLFNESGNPFRTQESVIYAQGFEFL